MRKKKRALRFGQYGKSLAFVVRTALVRCGVDPQEPLLVGFSGGVDSLALTLCIKELGIPAVLAHVDHGLRAESTAQVALVRDLAERLGLPLVVSTINVAAQSRELGIGLEDAGRRARYAFFAEVQTNLAQTHLKDQGRAWLALGHQADDLAEDVLLRLVRGAGWPALGGMCAVDAGRRLVRPLLYVPRAELEVLVAASGLAPVDDSSNASQAFRRNRLRHTVLPLLRAENPALTQSVRRLHEQARLDEDFWEAQLEPILAQAHRHKGRVSVAEAALRPLHPALRLRTYRCLLAMLPQAGQARADTLFALDKALQEQQRPKFFQFSNNSQAILANGRLEFACL